MNFRVIILALLIIILSLITDSCYGDSAGQIEPVTNNTTTSAAIIITTSTAAATATTAATTTTTTTTTTTNTTSIPTSTTSNISIATTIPTATTLSTTSATATATATTSYAVCDNADDTCWALVGVGSVIVAILLIAVITCIIFTATVIKGMNALIQYLSNSTRANGERDIQPQQQHPQNEVSGSQQTTGNHTQYYYDTIENEQAPVHYFELEPPPQHISTKAKQQRKPPSNSHGVTAMSKLHSLPKSMELPREEYNPPNVTNYPTAAKQKVSAVSLPPSVTQHSSTHTREASQQEKARGPLPIYSIPDKSKKSMKTILEPVEHEEIETEQLSRSHNLDSFFKPRVAMAEEEGGGDKGTPREGSSSPPPPLLPPKPRQTKSKATENAAGEGEESVYAEASSKPLQAHSQRKTNNYDEWTKTATATVMGNISPFHLHAHYSQKEQGHIHKRSLSAVDDMKRKEGHSWARLPASTEHDQHYHIALSLLESKEEEEEKLHL